MQVRAQGPPDQGHVHAQADRGGRGESPLAAGVLPHGHVRLAQLNKLEGLCLEFRTGDEGHEPPGADGVRADGQEGQRQLAVLKKLKNLSFEGL